MDGLHPDHRLIDALGGPTKVAEELQYEKDGGPQRVANWRRRGIPSLVRLERLDLFQRAEVLAASKGAPQVNGQAA